MNGWFELQRSSDDQFHFVLKAGNAEVILSSERYTTRAAAENGIARYARTVPTTRATSARRPAMAVTISTSRRPTTR